MSADLLLGLPAKVKQLLDRLTAARAAKLDNLDNLDATVSSRAPSSDTGTLLGRLTEPRADNLDLIPDLGGFGPPTGEISLPFSTIDDPTVDIPAACAQAYNEVPRDITAELLSLAGPGVLYFLACNKTASATHVLTFELEIDGVTVTPVGGKSLALIPLRYYTLVGGVVQYALTFQPIVYKTSVVLKVSHDALTSIPIYAYYRHIPT